MDWVPRGPSSLTRVDAGRTEEVTSVKYKSIIGTKSDFLLSVPGASFKSFSPLVFRWNILGVDVPFRRIRGRPCKVSEAPRLHGVRTGRECVDRPTGVHHH